MWKDPESPLGKGVPCGIRSSCPSPSSPIGEPMIDNAKITTAAKNFVKRFGKDAPSEAKRRAQEMKIFKNAEGYATWMQIYEEVQALLEEDDGGEES